MNWIDSYELRLTQRELGVLREGVKLLVSVAEESFESLTNHHLTEAQIGASHLRDVLMKIEYAEAKKDIPPRPVMPPL